MCRGSPSVCDRTEARLTGAGSFVLSKTCRMAYLSPNWPNSWLTGTDQRLLGPGLDAAEHAALHQQRADSPERVGCSPHNARTAFTAVPIDQRAPAVRQRLDDQVSRWRSGHCRAAADPRQEFAPVRRCGVARTDREVCRGNARESSRSGPRRSGSAASDRGSQVSRCLRRAAARSRCRCRIRPGHARSVRAKARPVPAHRF